MTQKTDKEIADFFKKRLENELGKTSQNNEEEIQISPSRAYSQFKNQYLPKTLSIYETICQFSEKILPYPPDKKKSEELEKYISTCHLSITPTGVYSASLIIPLLLTFLSIIIFFMIPLALGNTGNLFFVVFFMLISLAIIIPLQNIPKSFSTHWRLKASNQMVLGVFYIVTYMRHTSNLELAIRFASEHLAPPLALDMRKIIWNVQTEKYDSLKDSLFDYLETWRQQNPEFVQSLHLIQSSLYESTDEKRRESLDRALQVMLDETYEKMLHYTHGLKSPLTTLNMLGVVLPILIIVILPLVVSFMEGFRWWHLLALYNILLPSLVFFLGKQILSTRPGGGSEEDVTAKHPELKKLEKIEVSLGSQKTYLEPLIFALLFAAIFMLIGLLPIFWHATGLPDYGIVEQNGKLGLTSLEALPADAIVKASFLSFQERTVNNVKTGEMVGPFGLGALILSVLFVFGIGRGIGFYYETKSKNLIGIRNKAKALELEFSSALFQLGNRIGDGVPAELAFGKVAQDMQGTTSGNFFLLVHINITRLGMGVESAIFDSKRGAINTYPSDLIESSMKVLIESAKKGPKIAGQALINVSDYIKQMHRVDERLKDLLEDVLSSIKSQLMFLAPVISAIVVGITSLITTIIMALGEQTERLADQATGMQGAGLMSMFGVGIPTFQFQIVVGLYVVQLAIILSLIASRIENGPDDITENYMIGRNVKRATTIYCVLALIVIILFNVVASSILSSVF